MVHATVFQESRRVADVWQRKNSAVTRTLRRRMESFASGMLRTLESLVIRQPWELESVASNPTVLTENGRASQSSAMAAVSKTAEQQCLEGSTPSPSA